MTTPPAQDARGIAASGTAALADVAALAELRAEADRARETLTRLLDRIDQATGIRRAGDLALAPLCCAETVAEANAKLVIALLGCHDEVAQATNAAEAAARAVGTDALTGLATRTALAELLPHALMAAKSRAGRAAVLFVDLDRFKRVNDTAGHAAGDEVLKAAAAAIVSAVRQTDTVGRHGGDEFLVLLPEIDAIADATCIADKVLGALAATVIADAAPAGVAASIGVAVYPDDGGDPQTLIACADAAMFRSKPPSPSASLVRDGRDAAERGDPSLRADSGRVPITPDVLLLESNERLLVTALATQELCEIAETALRDHSKGVAMVVHELRNPLMPIRAAAALLRNADPAQLQHMQGVIERQVAHLARLVDDLMAVSRADRGKFRLRIETLDISQLLRDVRETCEPGIAARGQSLRIHYPQATIELPGDPERLNQVFSNLVFNACKYTPEGGHINVDVKTRAGSVIVTVSDTGIGIGVVALPHVFDAFVQEGRAARYNGDGLGIGLAVVRELVHAHGGSVVATSEGLGRGSRFEVTLPRGVRRA